MRIDLTLTSNNESICCASFLPVFVKDYSLITGDVNFAHLKKILMKEERLCRTDQRNHADIPDVQNSLTEDTARNIYLSIRKLHARQPSEATAASGGRKAKLILEKHPLCESCKRNGKYVQAAVVDHIKPHRGDSKLFWDKSNWQSLCKSCHDKKTGNEDSRPTYSYN